MSLRQVVAPSTSAVRSVGVPSRSGPLERAQLLAAWWIAATFILVPLARPEVIPGFRDAAHYYAPLLQLVHRSWRTGFPLWNRFEEGGRPLLADPTAAVLYPGQCLFALPCSFATNYRIYVVAHVLVAGWSSYRMARQGQLSRTAATLASLTYAFSGSVVFQIHNVPYLIGAAWLPLALSGLLALASRLRWHATCQCAFAWSMIVLGGDLQLAYLLVVIAGLIVVLHGTTERVPRRATSGLRQIVLALGRVLPALVLGWGLTAAQWLPTATWSIASERMAGDVAATKSLNGATTSRYDFSVPPWRWWELAWPHFSGHVVPQHTRWLQAGGYEDRFWTPSLYQGMSTVFLAIPGLRSALAPRWRRGALGCLVVLGCWGSLGRFDVGAMVATGTPHNSAGDWRDAAETTWGFYWLLSHLPLFAAFRFPGKMWVWTALGLSQLAALGWDDWHHDSSSPAPLASRRRWLMLIALWCAGILFVGIVMRSLSLETGLSPPRDRLWGPLQCDLAWRQVAEGCVHAILVTGLLHVVMRWRRALAVSWLFVTALDVGWAHRHTVSTIPVASITTQSPLLPPDVDAGETSSELRMTRYLRRQTLGWYPRMWESTTSSRRLEECVYWDRLTLRPKYHLLQHGVAMSSNTSFSTRDHRQRLQALDQCRDHSLNAWVNALRYWGIRYVIGSESIDHPHLKRHIVSPPDHSLSERFTCWEVIDVLPRVRWVPHAVWKRRDAAAPSLTTQLRELWQRDDFLSLAQHTVWLDASTSSMDPKSEASASASVERLLPGRSVITDDADSHLTIEIDAPEAGWIVLQDAYDRGWHAQIRHAEEIQRLPLVGTLVGERAFPVPAGFSVVELRYEPWEWICGLTISSIAWVGMGLTSVLRYRRRRRLETRAL